MDKKDADKSETNQCKAEVFEEPANETNPSTKLERRRRIEDLMEEKLLRKELEEFELS